MQCKVKLFELMYCNQRSGWYIWFIEQKLYVF